MNMKPIEAAFSFLKGEGGPMRALMDNPADPQSQMISGDDEKLHQAYEEAHKEIDTHHKKKQTSQKKRDEMNHRNSKKDVDKFYEDNHPSFFDKLTKPELD